MNSRLNNIHHSMLQRCYYKKHHAYNLYGGRGITVCDEWKNNFKAFKKWALANGYQDSLTLDRIDNNKGYSPENCRWATQKQQCNNRTNNHLVTYRGKTKTLAEWCDELGLYYRTIANRVINKKWSAEKAFETKIKRFPTRKWGLITYKGKTQTLFDWCQELNLNYNVTRTRLRRNWTVERAFEQPKGIYKH